MARNVNDIKLSKCLSYVLRHGAQKYGMELQMGGFLYVDEMLQNVPELRRFSLEDVERIVKSNEKQRFHIEYGDRPKIRANQGHSMPVRNLELEPITSAALYPVVVHGTYRKNWHSIKQTGLSRMTREHVHFAPGEPGDDDVISGMRQSCNLLIYLDLASALSDGLEFFLSANNVILTPGNEHGFVLTKYFKQVIDRKTKDRLL